LVLLVEKKLREIIFMFSRYMSVYIIVNVENNKVYIGQTRGPLDKRFKQHCEPNRTSKSIISQAIQKHGKDCFYMETLWESPGCSREELDSREIELIREYNSLSPYGYNITSGGGGSLSPSEEMRKKMSESAKKKFEEHPELRKNLSVLRSTEVHSEERRKRQSETMKQKYKNDAEYCEKLKNSRTGILVSEVNRKKRRNGLINSIKEHPERFRKIYMFNKDRSLVQTFDKLADADRAGFDRGSIVRCIKSGQLFKKSVYFSYSSTLPPVSAFKAAEECSH
jgi:group I intron endonuclease